MTKAMLIALAGLMASPIGLHGQDAESKPAATRDVAVADGQTVSVRIALSSATRNLVTAVTFPEIVKNVISAWDPKDLSIEHDGAKLFAKLLAKSEGHVDVTTASGRHVRLFIQPSAAEFDSHVVIKFDREEKQAPASSGALELIRAMRLGVAPRDAVIRQGKSEVLAETAEMKASLLWTYDTGRFHGLVLGVANPSKSDTLQLDVTRFASEDLVLVGARDLAVPPGGSTRLYLVLAKR